MPTTAEVDALDRAVVYADTRGRITELVRDLDEAALATAVPACPGWTVKDVVAHATGVPADILAGNLEGVATDPWTQKQVDDRRGHTISQILDEWSEKSPQVEALLGAFPAGAASQMVFDLVTHEHDLRGALRAPGARDSDGVAIALEFGVRGFQASLGDRPPVTVTAGERTWGEAGGASVSGDPFELLRAFSGRRSPTQIAALDWDGDPEPYLPAFAFGPFQPPAEPLQD